MHTKMDPCTYKKTEAKSWYTNYVSTHEKKKQRDQHREHNCNRPLTVIITIIIIIIINIFEYLALSTTLYPLTSIIP